LVDHGSPVANHGARASVSSRDKRPRLRRPLIPIAQIFGRDRRIVQHQQILCIPVLRTPGVIEAPGENRLAIDHHDFIVHKPRYRIDQHRHPGGSKASDLKCIIAVLMKLVAIDDYPHVNPLPFGRHQGADDLLQSERVHLDANCSPGAVNRAQYRE
jgi:hypothetical protein